MLRMPLCCSAAFGAEAAQFVEEDDARRLPAGGPENIMSIALGVSDPHVEHVADRHGDEFRAELRGDGLGHGGEQMSYSAVAVVGGTPPSAWLAVGVGVFVTAAAFGPLSSGVGARRLW